MLPMLSIDYCLDSLTGLSYFSTISRSGFRCQEKCSQPMDAANTVLGLIKSCSLHICASCIQSSWFNDLPPQSSAAGFDSSFFSFFLPLASGCFEPSHLKESRECSSQSTRPNRAHPLVTLVQAGPWYFLGSFLAWLGFLLWLWLCRARTASSLTFSNDLSIPTALEAVPDMQSSLFAMSVCLYVLVYLCMSFAHLLLRQSQEMVDGTVQIFVSTIPKTGQKPWKQQGRNLKGTRTGPVPRTAAIKTSKWLVVYMFQSDS